MTKETETEYVDVELGPISYEEIGMIALEAHKRHMTLNDFIVELAVNRANEIIAYNEQLKTMPKAKAPTTKNKTRRPPNTKIG